MILRNLENKYPELTKCLDDIRKSFDILKSTYNLKGKVLLCGNGGSASDCEHIVGELMKGFLLERPIDRSFKTSLLNEFSNDGEFIGNHLQMALPAISLVSQTSLITAISNDLSPDMVFAQQVFAYGVKGDTIIGISTSGNSKNVLYALKTAKVLGLRTIGITGASGGSFKDICDITICVPFHRTLEIQEKHVPIYHALCAMLEEEYFLR
ncbi:D-sedoheptulose-7-phosphate isomerase [Bacillus timonensis]|uniref:D-sedoheptulose-7-phosphate isomerase n=1 Tax=Bacillus timonensis TaxID=1033734 RepID=UPI0005A991A7|nr:SIS domain-containing protein [Bacillus timonensis]